MRMTGALSAMLFSLATACSSEPTANYSDHQTLYKLWCAYNVEIGEIDGSVNGCAQRTWARDQDESGKKRLYNQFASVSDLSEYIAVDSALRHYCDLMKNSQTPYESMLGVTRIGELSYSECKYQITQMNMLSEVLQSVPYDPAGSRRWTYEPGVTYRINGDVYNDPFGLDYKNGPSDVFGDGK